MHGVAGRAAKAASVIVSCSPLSHEEWKSEKVIASSSVAERSAASLGAKQSNERQLLSKVGEAAKAAVTPMGDEISSARRRATGPRTPS